jgi:Ca2+-transporting ATPase
MEPQNWFLIGQRKRIIGFAQKETPSSKKKINSDDAKQGLTWIGLLAFYDPVRPGVKEALKLALEAGIKTITITGDYAQTAQFVLKELDIPVKKEEIITGDELEKLTVDELAQKVKSIRLFARTSPNQKLTIVNALKKNGEVVAMMGDGVNDAPALHKADIGIVVASASDVAKQSADLVLLDSNFATIVKAIEEGRGMFENIRKIILYLMSDAFAEIILVIGGILLGLPLPLTAVQILWINIVSDGFPSMALTIDPKRKNIMKEKPRPPHEKLVMPWMVVLIAIVSSVAGIASFLAFYIVYKNTGDILMARSAAFVTLGFDSLAYVFSVRSLMTPLWENHLFENKWLILAVFTGLILQVLPFATVASRQFFGLENLDSVYWLMAAGLSISMFFIIEIFKGVYKLNK